MRLVANHLSGVVVSVRPNALGILSPKPNSTSEKVPFYKMTSLASSEKHCSELDFGKLHFGKPQLSDKKFG